MSRIALIDHGLGNLQAVEKALTKVAAGAPVFLCHQPEELSRADCVVLPGTGQLAACVSELDRLGLAEALSEFATQRPVLAINIGLHALCYEGLNLIPARVQPLNDDGAQDIRLPHLGWNRVHQRDGHPLWDGIAKDAHFYFAHRNQVVVESDDKILGHTRHGERFASTIRHGLFVGVQFQPETSSMNGLKFLANFISWDGRE
ncbi:MAG: imidazole glycerol phosphate synthase subunit HisH [Gammaproteobacteria bacterium]|nr:imidazole glycerol phosphate synthase subunit HisH [Gammaproteobacteria bacterium]